MNRFVRFALVAALALATGSTAVADPTSDGLQALSAGDLVTAERSFREALARDPGSAEAQLHLGLVHSRQGRPADALARFDRALELDPGLDDLHLSRGIALHQLGRHAEAAESFEIALRRNPNDASALLFLGLSRLALDQPRAAIEPLRRAARNDRGLAQLALYNVGLAHWQAGDAAAARTALEDAIALDPMTDTAADARMLKQMASTTSRPSRRWSLAGSIGFEADDNVNQSEIDASSDASDVLGVFEISPAFRVLDGDRGVVEVGYDFFGNVHDTNDEFDLDTHGVYIDGSTELGPLDLGLAYRFDHSRLDGDRFLEIHGVRPSVGFSIGSQGYVDVAYQFQDRDFASSRRDAEHHDFGFDGFLFFRGARGYASLGYRVIDEDASGPEFDYLGHRTRVGVRVPLPVVREAAAILGYEFSLRDYDEITPSIGRRRDDRRHSVRLGLEKVLRNGILARFDYEFVESESNLPSVDFTQNVVGMSLAFDF
jgi:Tfp pilus assembly protein PilF